MQVYDDDDLHEGQRSSEVECGKRCTLVTKLGQKESLMQVYDGDVMFFFFFWSTVLFCFFVFVFIHLSLELVGEKKQKEQAKICL